jgi:phenylpropionate dioxygenase-like ring-hydroxylating dioxygenase large terminal subunit
VDGRVRCPYHGWAYDENGRLESVPDGQAFEAGTLATSSLAALPVTQWRGLVFVAFGTPERPLESALGAAGGDWPDLAALRRSAEPRSVDVAADWKLACEHALDTAHLRIARTSPKSRLYEPGAYAPVGPDALYAPGTPVDATRASWPARACLQLLGEGGRRAEFLFLWPNLLLCLGAGTLTVVQALPAQPGRCRLRALRYGTAEATAPARRVRYLQERVLRRALLDDSRLLERAQLGLATFTPTATFPVDDAQHGLRWFVERCRAALHEPGAAATKPRAKARRTRAAVVAPMG